MGGALRRSPHAPQSRQTGHALILFGMGGALRRSPHASQSRQTGHALILFWMGERFAAPPMPPNPVALNPGTLAEWAAVGRNRWCV
jgi:hypothetical protein